jgi:hypothetical protein
MTTTNIGRIARRQAALAPLVGKVIVVATGWDGETSGGTLLGAYSDHFTLECQQGHVPFAYDEIGDEVQVIA